MTAEVKALHLNYTFVSHICFFVLEANVASTSIKVKKVYQCREASTIMSYFSEGRLPDELRVNVALKREFI